MCYCSCKHEFLINTDSKNCYGKIFLHGWQGLYLNDYNMQPGKQE